MARFLVIDDDNTIRQLIVMALVSAGHEAAEASTGREGIRLFQSRRPDVIITDQVMPEDGLALVLELREANPDVPIILITGLAENFPSTVSVAAALCARRTLPKPFRLADLLNTVKEVLAEEKTGPETGAR